MIRLEPRFAELAAMTNFSFLRGASHPEEMVARAAELGLAGIGIADRNTLAGVVRAHTFARENAAAMGGVAVVPGARLVLRTARRTCSPIRKDRAAYGRLCRILTAGNLRAPKGECWLKLDDLLEHGEGLQVVALPLAPASGRDARPPSPARASKTPVSTATWPLLPQGERALRRKGGSSRPAARGLRSALMDRREPDLRRDMRGGLARAWASRAPSGRR